MHVLNKASPSAFQLLRDRPGVERTAQVPVSEHCSNADYSTYTKWDVKFPCVKIPFGFGGLGQAFTYRECQQSAVNWTGKEDFALIKATEFFNPSLAFPGHRSFTDKPQVLIVMHSSSRNTNIWKAFSLNKQYLTAWKPTAVLLLRFPQIQECEAIPCLSAPCCGCTNPLQLRGTRFYPSWTLKDER